MSDKDRQDNEIKKERRVVQDSNNSSIYRGRSNDRATLSFDFDKKPTGLDPKKPGTPSSSKKTPVKTYNNLRSVSTDRSVRPSGGSGIRPVATDKDAAPSFSARNEKHYGLEDYVIPDDSPKSAGLEMPAEIIPEESRPSTKEALNSTKEALKKKYEEKKEAVKAARAARAAEAEKKKKEAAIAAAMAKAVEEEERKKNVGKAASVNKANAAGRPVQKPAVQKTNTAQKQTAAKKSGASQKAASAKASAAKAKAKAAAARKKKKPGKPGGKSSGSKAGRYILAAVKVLLTLMIVGGIAGGAYVAITIANAPKIHPENIYNTLDVSTHIYDDKGELISDLYYSENRDIATYDQFPDNLKNAFIAIEDKTFWEHKGFNFRRIIGAVWNSVTGGGEISGTSTITQQLARNVFLPEEKSVRSIKRKIIEMYYAREIEEVLSKEEILTAYLNTIYLGYGCYGVDTAAKTYFSTDVENLTLEQCAALAALPQAPGVYALLTTEAGDNTTEISDGLYANDISQERRYMVLDLMAQQGYITQEEADAAKKPATEILSPGKSGSDTSSAFKDYLIETVIKDLMAQYDMTEDQASKLVYTKGLHIYSTLDSQAQRVITKEFKNKKSFPDSLKENSKVEAAMVITEVGTGQIKAMAGTRSAEGDMLFNRATSPRQPGSSIKPLAVYAAALQKSYECQQNGQKFPFVKTGYDSQEDKNWGDYITASSYVKDEKMKVNGNVWPQNFSKTYSGSNTFRTAIQQSINTCAVKILAQVGVEYSMDLVKQFGITTVVDDTNNPTNDVNLAALGLGAMTYGTTPLEMALAYATFPNGGVRNSGVCYTKVTDSEGNVLLEGKSEETKVLDEGVAWIMTDVLKSVVSRGIAGDAAISGVSVGGKTGTTDDTWDIWFDGFTPTYSASLWIGTDDNTTLNATSSVAAALWGRIMGKVDRADDGEYKGMPHNITLRDGEFYTDGTEPPVKKKEENYHSSTTEPETKTVSPEELARKAAEAAQQAAQQAGGQ